MRVVGITVAVEYLCGCAGAGAVCDAFFGMFVWVSELEQQMVANN
jgi:hypothetical protein